MQDEQLRRTRSSFFIGERFSTFRAPGPKGVALRDQEKEENFCGWERMENSGRESRKSFRFKKRAKPTHPTLEGKCYAETEIHHSLTRLVCLKLKHRNKFNRKKPKLKARTKAKHREPHLDQTMGHTCFA